MNSAATRSKMSNLSALANQLSDFFGQSTAHKSWPNSVMYNLKFKFDSGLRDFSAKKPWYYCPRSLLYMGIQ